MTALIAVGVVAAIAALAAISYYNSFVGKRNTVDQAFSTIDVMLKKRSDLIPNLVATVRQYMTHEAGSLTRIAELRSRAANAKETVDSRVAANNELSGLLGGLMIQVENYPDLKANQNFLELQTSLSGMEEQLSAARRTFNAVTADFNIAVEMFPGALFARLFGFHRRPLLETPAEDRKLPDVKALFRS